MATDAVKVAHIVEPGARVALCGSPQVSGAFLVSEIDAAWDVGRHIYGVCPDCATVKINADAAAE